MTKITILASLVLTACVSQGRYDEVVKSGDTARVELQHTQVGLEERAREDQRRITVLTNDLARHDKMIADFDARLADAVARADALKASLDATSAADAQLRRAQAAAVARAELYRQLAFKLKSMVDARELSIVLHDGRMVLRMPNDVLFDSGSVLVKPTGLRALAEVAAVLKTVTDRRFQIAGHTDNVPISTPRFASNWDLSTARAVEVVRVLAAHGLRQPLLSAAGYGEVRPRGLQRRKRRAREEPAHRDRRSAEHRRAGHPTRSMRFEYSAMWTPPLPWRPVFPYSVEET
jgi:chemotaxis protein MotB